MDEGSGPVASETWPFVGRQAALEQALAAVRDEGSGGVVVHGAAGVGRSRFAAEVLARAEAEGSRAVQAFASSAGEAVPFGAIAHLLPPEILLGDDDHDAVAVDPVRVLASARQAFAEEEGSVVVAVDDAHRLDALSLMLLGQLANEGLVSLVLTVRLGDPEPDLLSTLWRTGRLLRIDLAPLDAPAVGTLLHLALGGPVDGRAANLLSEASEGNPLLLRELVRSAADDGTLVARDGVWRLTGPLPAARRAVDLVAHRIAQVPDEARPVLDLLALVGPTPLDLVDRLVPDDALEQLEADGLLLVTYGTGAGGPAQVSLAQRAVGDAVREQLPTLRRRRILREHADRVAAWPDRQPEDDLRIAGWRLDAGEAADPDVLERAATLARHAEDHITTVRLARAADAARPTLRTAVLLADALYEITDFDEAEVVFAAGLERPGNAFDRLRLVGARGTNLLFGHLRSDEAVAFTRRALEEAEASDPRWLDGIEPEMLETIRADLRSRVAMLHMYDGDPAAALAELGPVPPPVPEGSDDDLFVRDALRSRVIWAIAGVPAMALAGRTVEAAELAAAAFGEHGRLGGEVGFSSIGTHLLTWAFALQEQGDLDQAHGVAQAGYDVTVATGQALGQVWFGLSQARLALQRAQADTALRWCRESAAAAGAAGWMGPRIMSLTGTAAALALKGDLEGSREASATAAATPGRFGFLFPERILGPAWAAAAAGNVEEAGALLRGEADRAAATGHLGVEAWLRHEVVRLGTGADQVPRLRELADASDSRFTALRADHAEALVAADVDRLEEVAGRFEELGCHLVAAEALAVAAELARATDQERVANSLAVRSAAALRQADGATSPRLVLATASVVALTGREREVAELAAAGLPSQEIAEQLYLSIRTVNNHLQKAYTKLGVSSRTELSRALADQPD